jgi:hypothetical protein
MSATPNPLKEIVSVDELLPPTRHVVHVFREGRYLGKAYYIDDIDEWVAVKKGNTIRGHIRKVPSRINPDNLIDVTHWTRKTSLI